MLSTLSTPRVTDTVSVEHLLDVVETRMIETISVNTHRVSKKLMGAVDAATYHLSAGGQRIRAKIALQMGLALDLNLSDAVTIATAVELLHNASLVHDDIQDRDEMRRGQKAVWVSFGANTAICTGDLLLSAAYAALCKLENSHALASMISLVHTRTAMAIDGQCADLMVGDAAVSDTASEIARYKQIAIAKSGALLSLPLELVLLAAKYEAHLSDAKQAAEAFAVCYQIVDDLDDVVSDEGVDGSRGALNIVSVFRSKDPVNDPVENAKALGRQHLEICVASATRLPCHAGAPLIYYAHALGKLLSPQNERS